MKTLLLLLMLMLGGLTARAALAPIRCTYTNDLCWRTVGTNCLTVDYTGVSVLQRAHKGIMVEASDDLINWQITAYWSPPQFDREMSYAWYVQTFGRREHFFFRALEFDESLHLAFCCPFPPLPNTIATTNWITKSRQ